MKRTSNCVEEIQVPHNLLLGIKQEEVACPVRMKMRMHFLQAMLPKLSRE
jgi:hypothetical protein